MNRIALAQTTTTDDLAANLAKAAGLIEQAASGGAKLLAFPEVFLYLGGARGKLEAAQSLDGEIVREFRDSAARHGMMILLGSIHEAIPRDLNRVYNTSVLIGSAGELLGWYRKLKLFDVELPEVRIRESDTIAAGSTDPPVVGTPLGNIGLTICFDLRFPDLYQGLRSRQADLVFVPSNFTVPTGKAHWEVLLRARAVENQYYVAAPAQTGAHNPRYRSYGHSLLIDPWGSVLADAGEDPGMVFGNVDLDLVRRVRERLPMNG